MNRKQLRYYCRCLSFLVLVFFINPIGASEGDPGCIEFKPGDQPIHSAILREGPSPELSRWFYRPTYPCRTPTARCPRSRTNVRWLVHITGGHRKGKKEKDEEEEEEEKEEEEEEEEEEENKSKEE